MARHGTTWTQRTTEDAQNYAVPADDIERHLPRQAFHHPHTTLGVAGHLVHMGAMLFPVLAAELITDAAKYKKSVRIGSIATTVLYEGLYTMREHKRRQEQEAKLDACQSHD